MVPPLTQRRRLSCSSPIVTTMYPFPDCITNLCCYSFLTLGIRSVKAPWCQPPRPSTNHSTASNCSFKRSYFFSITPLRCFDVGYQALHIPSLRQHSAACLRARMVAETRVRHLYLDSALSKERNYLAFDVPGPFLKSSTKDARYVFSLPCTLPSLGLGRAAPYILAHPYQLPS